MLIDGLERYGDGAVTGGNRCLRVGWSEDVRSHRANVLTFSTYRDSNSR